MRMAVRLALLLSLYVLNAPSALAQQPAGMAPCGVPIVIYPTGMGGMSTFYNGQPIVVIDPPVAAGDPAFRLFTIWHECGHHVRGHTLPQGLMMRWFMSGYQELEADCFAAQNVPRQVAMRAAQYFAATQGHFSPAPGYPSGNMRAQNIMDCAR